MYASQLPSKRVELWNFIYAIMSSWQGSIVTFGDFNEVRNESERRGSSIDERATNKFNEFIRHNNLIDVKIVGSNFTWIKGGGTKLSKLDRFLINDCFDFTWPNSEVSTDARIFSDHKPLIQHQSKRCYGNSPFKFYNSWLEDEELEKLI